MDQHIKILSILFIILGALGLLVAVLMLLGGAGIAAGIGAQAGNDPDAAKAALASGGCFTALAVFIGVLSLPSILAGWGLMKRKSWARVLTIIVSILSLPSFPLGTAIGVYGLWVMFNEETKRLLVA